MRVLIVEDDGKAARTLRRGLEESGLVADVVGDGAAALAATRQASYDVVVLDVMLPGIDGFQVCSRLRTQGTTSRVLMLSARGAVHDRVAGLEAGADDYLRKPFAFEELLARLRALSRREPGSSGLSPVSVGDISIDGAARRAYIGAQLMRLTRKEFDILTMLTRRAGSVVTRGALHDEVWQADTVPESNLVEVYAGRLRRKLADANSRAAIATVRGIGYRLDPDG